MKKRMHSLATLMCLVGTFLIGLSFSAGFAIAEPERACAQRLSEHATNLEERTNMADQTKTHVRIENTSERVIHIQLAGGRMITVPPSTKDNGGGITVTFDDGKERERFDQALQTQAVQQWITSKELVVHGGAAAPPPQPPSGSTTDPASSPTSPALKRGRSGAQE